MDNITGCSCICVFHIYFNMVNLWTSIIYIFFCNYICHKEIAKQHTTILQGLPDMQVLSKWIISLHRHIHSYLEGNFDSSMGRHLWNCCIRSMSKAVWDNWNDLLSPRATWWFIVHIRSFDLSEKKNVLSFLSFVRVKVVLSGTRNHVALQCMCSQLIQCYGWVHLPIMPPPCSQGPYTCMLWHPDTISAIKNVICRATASDL